MDLRLARVAPEIVGEPKRSIFRIHRDIRFARDKSPYKTHAGCWFYHRDAGKRVGREADDGSAGYYVQVAPGDSFVGGGIWMPPRTALNKIRAAIAGDPRGFERVVHGSKLVRRFGRLSDEATLKRMPRGYAENHPAARWLRYQSFTVGRQMSDAEATSVRLTRVLETDFATMAPFVRWLNRALGLSAADSR
jgi:uncharacterized protein (TIGR02453 family)